MARPIPCLVRTWRELTLLDALPEDEVLEWDRSWQRVADAFAIETKDRNRPEDALALARSGAGRDFMRRMVSLWLSDLPRRLLVTDSKELDEIGSLLGVERCDLRDTSYAFRLADEILIPKEFSP